MPFRPRVRERKRRRLGDRRDELLDLVGPTGSSPAQWRSSRSRWRARGDPLRRRARPAGRRRPSRHSRRLAGTARRPTCDALPHFEGQNVARLGARLGQRRVLLHFLGDEGEGAAGGWRSEILRDRLHVGDLPAVRKPAAAFRRPSTPSIDDEPRIAEQAAAVAQLDDVRTATALEPSRARRPPARTGAGGARAPSRPSADRCRRSGRRASDPVRRPRPHPTQRPFRTVIRLPSDSRTMRPLSSVR